jgi:hypothetical protein
MTVGPTPDLFLTSLAYDEVRRAVVMTGGVTPGNVGSLSTFDYGVVAPASAISFGFSCQGTFNLPFCRRAPGSANHPWIGTTFELRVLMGAGNSATLNLGLNAIGPFGLGAFGLPHCFIYTDSIATASLTADASGVAGFSLPIPDDPVLAGFKMFTQALCMGPTALDSTSNALELTFNAK